MAKKSTEKIKKTSKSKLKTYKQVLADYKTGVKEAKKDYLKKLDSSKFKSDKLLKALPDMVLSKKLKDAVESIQEQIKDRNIEVEEITLSSAQSKLKKGKKLTQKAKTIYIPPRFSDRDFFTQIIFLQHQYKLCLYSTSKSSKTNKDILLTSLALIVVAIKANYPSHLTEDLYDRYRLSLESL
ncbi:hypothetical protein JXA63_03905 [Candidatus Woesebacteria bacterium]|nr:hypothetical protein [Candidatus Woesebacteria bacterium]